MSCLPLTYLYLRIVHSHSYHTAYENALNYHKHFLRNYGLRLKGKAAPQMDMPGGKPVTRAWTGLIAETTIINDGSKILLDDSMR